MPRLLSVAMAAAGSGSTPRIRPRRRGFLPSLEATCGANRFEICSEEMRPTVAQAEPRPAVSARLEFFRNLRRFCSVIRISLELLHVLESICLSNVEILPPDLNSPASVNLETDDTLGELGRRISEVHGLDSVQRGDDVIAMSRDQQVIPVAGLQRFLAILGRHAH